MADEKPLNPANDPASPAQKPGWMTSEFALTAAASLVGFLLSAGVFQEGSLPMKVLGIAASLLAILGYQVQRGFVKASGNKAAALVAAASAQSANPPKA